MVAEQIAPSVLVTRPAGPASEGLCTLLNARGFRAVAQPLLELQPVESLTPGQKQLIQELDNFRHAIFISANAVRFGVECLATYWPQWPVGLRWYAIGDATAGLLAEAGIQADTPGGEMTSEALLALPGLLEVAQDRVLIVKGEGGRDTLNKTLSARGARVAELACYRRCSPQLPQGQLLGRLLTERIEALLLSSGEGLENFARLLRSAESTNVAANLGEVLRTDLGGAAGTTLGQTPLIVPSDRVARLAREMGFSHIITAQNASDHAMVAALEKALPPSAHSPDQG